MLTVENMSPRYKLFLAELTKSISRATFMPFLHFINFYTDSPSVAVVQCKMRGWLVVVVLIATLAFHGTAQLLCKL